VNITDYKYIIFLICNCSFAALLWTDFYLEEINEVDASKNVQIMAKTVEAFDKTNNVFLLTDCTIFVKSNTVINSNYCYFNSKDITWRFPQYCTVERDNTYIEMGETLVDHKTKTAIGTNVTMIIRAAYNPL
jgi:hypothetical protein